MKKLTIVIIVFLLFTACSRQTRIRNYYVFDPVSQSETQNQRMAIPEPFRVYVDVRDFEISQAFDDTRIVARSASHEIQYYFYHHWAVRPSAAIADMIFEQLDEIQLFQKLTRGFAANAGYILSGKIFAIERMISEKGDACHVHLVLELVDERTGVVMVRHEFDRTVSLQDKGMNSFAVEMSRVLTEENHVFFQHMITFFESKKQRTES